jgi:hypothetical protein
MSSRTRRSAVLAGITLLTIPLLLGGTAVASGEDLLPVLGAQGEQPVDPYTSPSTAPSTQPLGSECGEFETLSIENGPIGRWFTPGRRSGSPTHIVIHTTESPREPGGELNVASWLSRTDYRASAHYVIGTERTLLTVDLADTAWGVGSAGNATGVQLELIGYASHDRDEWLQPDGRLLLCRAAALAAALSVTYDIPLRRVETQGLLDGVAGVAGHHAYTQAFGGSTHTDPGEGFPWDSFLAQAASMLEQARTSGPLQEDVLKPDLPSGLPSGTTSPEEGALAELDELRRIMRELETQFDDLAIISKLGGVIEGVNGPGDPFEGFGKGDDPKAARSANR